MDINELITRKLKQLRVKKSYSLEDISKKVYISRQGYHRYEQMLNNWNISILTQLSKILGFSIVIKDGDINIYENSSYENNTKSFEIEDFTINNYENEIYEGDANTMVEKLNLLNSERFDIIKLYTSPDNINFEYGDILEETLIYSNKKEAENELNTDNLVPVYALYDNEDSRVFHNSYGLDKVTAYTRYYWGYAPVLDDDNTVYRDISKNIKVSKKYVRIDTENKNEDGTYPILCMLNDKIDMSLGVFVTTDLDDVVIPGVTVASELFPRLLVD